MSANSEKARPNLLKVMIIWQEMIHKEEICWRKLRINILIIRDFKNFTELRYQQTSYIMRFRTSSTMQNYSYVSQKVCEIKCLISVLTVDNEISKKY